VQRASDASIAKTRRDGNPMAAQRVNLGFLTALGLGLLIVFAGVAYLGYQVVSKSGEEYAQQGAEFAAAGDYEEAAEAYGRAVGHDRTNVEWMRAWRDALVKTRPETEVEYNDRYRTVYLGTLNSLAVLQPYELEPQMDFLAVFYEDAKLSPNAPSVWQRLSEMARSRYEQLPAQTEGRDRVLRYRGLAEMRLLRLLPPQVGAVEAAELDLRAAIAADPTDLESWLGLVQISMTEWQRLLRERRPELAEREFEEAMEINREIQAQFPDHPAGLISELGSRVTRVMATTVDREQRRSRLDELTPLYERTVAALEGFEASRIDSELINRFHSAANLVNRQEATETALAQTDRALESQEEASPTLLIGKAELLMRIGRYEEAVETTARLRALPDPTIGIEGRILRIARQNAIGRQARAHLGVWESSPEEDREARREAIAKARTLRDELAASKTQGADDPDVMLLDAQIAMAERDYGVAINRLRELERLGVTDTAQGALVFRLLADALTEREELGAAQEYYDRLLEATPGDVATVMKAFNVDIQLRDFESAERRLLAGLDRDPNNRTLETLLDRLRRTQGDEPSGVDPVADAIEEVEDLIRQDPPRYEASRRLLADLDERYPQDYRIINARILLEAQAGENTSVRRLVDEAADRFPLVPAFEDYRTRLQIAEADDPIEAMLDRIDAEEASEAEKAARKHLMLRRLGRTERADAFLDEAIELDPEHPAVLDLRFGRAIERGEMDAARRLAARATELNADQAGGLLFEARLALASEDEESALTSLLAASERRPLDSQVWRLLGRVQLRRGQTDAGLESLRRAFDYKPTDPRNAEALAEGLVALGRPAEALEVVERAREFPRGARDATLRELGLRLQATVGDPTQAIAAYERRLEAQPDNVQTMIALANLYQREERLDDAQRVIDMAEAVGDERYAQTLAILEARTLADADPEGEGVDRGAERLQQRVDALEGEERTIAQIGKAQFLLEHDREEEAIEEIRAAAETQDPEIMRADRVLANFFFEKAATANADRRDSLNERALESLAKVVEADADDPGRPFGIRRVEALMRLDRWEEAESTLERLAQAEDVDPVTVALLRAQAARGAGDDRAAMRLVDEAVEQAPDDPRPFLLRAQMNASEEELYGDVMKDLDQALSLQPGNAQARQLRVALLRRAGQADEAVAELREALAASPSDEWIRTSLFQQLLALERFDEAVLVAEGALAERPTATRWLVAAGDASRQWHESDRERLGSGSGDDHLREAAEFYERAYEREPLGPIAERAVDALLGLDDPDGRAALRIIEERDDVSERPMLMIYRARAMKEDGRTREAIEYAGEILQDLRSSAQVAAWALQLQRIFAAENELPTATDLRRTLAFMRGLEPPSDLAPMFRVQMMNLVLAVAPEEHPSAIRTLEEVADGTDDPVVLVRLYKSLGALKYGAGDYEGAVEAYKSGLEIAQNDLEFLNNVAFTLSKHLRDPEAALAYAERAAQIAPRNANVLDTLGTVQYALGLYGEAERTLRRARESAGAARELIPATLHLAMTRYEQGDRIEADRLARQVRELLDMAPGFRVEYAPDLEALMSKLDRTE